MLSYFADQGLTEENLDLIVGNGSMLAMVLNWPRQEILLDPTFNWCPQLYKLTEEEILALADDGLSVFSVCSVAMDDLQDHEDELVNY